MAQLLVLVCALYLVDFHGLVAIFRVLNFETSFCIAADVLQNNVVNSLIKQFVELVSNFDEFANGAIKHAKTILYLTNNF